MTEEDTLDSEWYTSLYPSWGSSDSVSPWSSVECSLFLSSPCSIWSSWAWARAVWVSLARWGMRPGVGAWGTCVAEASCSTCNSRAWACGGLACRLRGLES